MRCCCSLLVVHEVFFLSAMVRGLGVDALLKSFLDRGGIFGSDEIPQ